MKHKIKSKMRKWMAVAGMACILFTVIGGSSNGEIRTCVCMAEVKTER